MNTCFVTGASGHLGANLVRELLARGQAVRVLLREGKDHRGLEGLPIERVYGDLEDVGRLRVHMHGCARLYHLAGAVSLRAMDRSLLYRTNVVGTRNVLAAAQLAGVERVVHCSSFGAVGTHRDRASDEDSLLDPFEPAMDYDRSKAAAEAEVWRAVAAGLDVRIVNPSGLVGPWDLRPSPIGQALLDFSRGRLPVYVTGGHDFVPVRDAARGHVAAMEQGRAGGRYLLTGEYVSLDTVLGWLAEATGRRMPRWRIPARAVLPIAGIKDAIWTHVFPRSHPRFTRASIHLLHADKRADNRATRAALAWEPGPLREAFVEHLDWLRSGQRSRAAAAP